MFGPCTRLDREAAPAHDPSFSIKNSRLICQSASDPAPIHTRDVRTNPSVLFELIAARYERRSLPVTSSRPFGEWTSVFPDVAMKLAAVDRLVHYALILEMNVESYRQRFAANRQKQRALSDSKRDTNEKAATAPPI